MFLSNVDIDIFGKPCPMLIALLESFGVVDDIVCIDVFFFIPVIGSWVEFRLDRTILVNLVDLNQFRTLLIELLHFLDVWV